MRKVFSLKLVLTLMFLFMTVTLGLLPESLEVYLLLFEPALFLSLFCGILCGGFSGLLTGALAPVCIFFLTGKGNPVPDVAEQMILYGTGGLMAGIMYRLLYHALASSVSGLLAGRLAMGISGLAFSFGAGRNYTVGLFLTEAFGNSWPGLLCAVLLLPFLLWLLRKAGVLSVLYPKVKIYR